MRHGLRANTKMRTVTIKGSVRFTLLTIRLKNGKNGKRYGHGSGDKFGLTIVLNLIKKFQKKFFNFISIENKITFFEFFLLNLVFVGVNLSNNNFEISK